MPYPNKLRKLAEDKGTSEKALVIGALETTTSIRQAADKLEVTEGALRAAIKRMKLRVIRSHTEVVL